MINFKHLVPGILLTCSVTAVHAEGPWSVGAGALVAPNPYKGVRNRAYPVPLPGYEGDSFYLRGFNAGYYLWNDQTDKFSVTAYYSPLHFRPKDSNYNSMRLLKHRHATAMGGLSWVHNTNYGFLRTTLAGDILDNSNGISWDAAWLYRYNIDRLTVTPGIGVVWDSEKQNGYYYGVSGKEASRSGLNKYNPNNSWSPYFEVSVSYKLTNDWNVFGMGRYERLSNEVTNSPMINSHWTGVLLTGVNYNF